MLQAEILALETSSFDMLIENSSFLVIKEKLLLNNTQSRFSYRFYILKIILNV